MKTTRLRLGFLTLFAFTSTMGFASETPEPNVAPASTALVIRSSEKSTQKISQLRVEGTAVLNPLTQQARIFAEFSRTEGKLLFGKKEFKKDSDGKYFLDMNVPSLPFEFEVKVAGAAGDPEVEIFEITAAPADVPLEFTEWRFTPSLSYVYFAYTETAVSDFSESAIKVGFEAERSFAPSRWYARGETGILAIPFASNRSGFSARLFFGDLEGGYWLFKSEKFAVSAA